MDDPATADLAGSIAAIAVSDLDTLLGGLPDLISSLPEVVVDVLDHVTDGALLITPGDRADLLAALAAAHAAGELNPAGVVPLLNLERLETMARRAVNWAFPLLTAGLLALSRLLDRRSLPVRTLQRGRTVGVVIVTAYLLSAVLLRVREVHQVIGTVRRKLGR